MKKFVKFLWVLLLLVVLFLAGMILIPRYAMGIDIFDRSGWCATQGEFQYLDYFGRPITGWQTIDGKWYYFDPADGTMATGWTEVEGKHYYLDSAGVRQSGWLILADGTYYLDPGTAAAKSGWTELDGKTYYLNDRGRICTGLTEIGGKLYFLNSEGQKTSGWVEDNGQRYFLDADSAVTTGWADTQAGRAWFREDGSLGSGWTETDLGRYYLTADGTIATGWVDTQEGRLYLNQQGLPAAGWVDTDQGRAWLDENGIAITGWQEVDGQRYYFRENGIMAIGKVIIDDQAHYFTSGGQQIYLVNKWNMLPEDYEVELVSYGKHQIAAEANEDLIAMIEQLKGLGYYNVTSIYRTMGTQQYLWDRQYNNFKAMGYPNAEAEALTAEKVAIPGTSEHHLGLAVDIDGVKPVHNWLAEHSWEYGFIVRYPEDKTAVTGIEYEPWHYRYVGRELAQELYELGLCLEEYLDMLTQQAGSDAGTASNPEA